MQAQISLSHFQAMMGPYGLYQHATDRTPNLAEGYCTDDNARAVTFLVAYGSFIPALQKELESFIAPCWNYILDAKITGTTYHNFRDAKGNWLTHDISEDMYARLATTFVTIITSDWSTERKDQAQKLLEELMPTLENFGAPRAQAEMIMAASTYIQAGNTALNMRGIVEKYTAALTSLWKQHATDTWPWFENSMTYANALFPHAMLASMQVKPSETTKEILDASAKFLTLSTIENNIFMPIGSVGWYPKDGIPSRDNQQAIEADLTFAFFLAYQKTSPEITAAPYLWFYGQNDHQIVMGNSKDGSCLDGIFTTGPNINKGAESMLAFLSCELAIQKAPEGVRRFVAQKKSQLR